MTDTPDIVDIGARAMEPWVWSLEPPDISSAQARDAARARFSSALHALDAAGWAVVSKECKPEIIGAFWRQKNIGGQVVGEMGEDCSDYAAYRAMIAAAAQPHPTTGEGE